MTKTDATWMAGEWQVRFDDVLDRHLPPEDAEPRDLHRAMRYAALGGGKRFRPVLTYASGHALGVPQTSIDPIAAHIELIHAYSLIHDDLPAMDDDDLRRGRPTCHRAFDEATAILAGDALQALAFEVLAARLPAERPSSLEIVLTVDTEIQRICREELVTAAEANQPESVSAVKSGAVSPISSVIAFLLFFG